MLPSVTCTSYTLSGRAAGPLTTPPVVTSNSGAVALAHDRRPGKQSSGQRARGVGAGAEIIERVQLAVGSRDGDPQLAIAQVERDDELIGDRVVRPDRAEGGSREPRHSALLIVGLGSVGAFTQRRNPAARLSMRVEGGE